MNKLYCANVSCAKVNYYEAAKPKFCSFCGQPFSAGFSLAIAQVQHSEPAARTPARQQSRYVPQPVIIEEDDTTDFSNFEIKIGVRDFGKKLTLGDIQNGSSAVSDVDRPRGNDLDIEKVKLDNIRRTSKVIREEETE